MNGIYSKEEAAQKLGVCIGTIDNLIRDGKISYSKLAEGKSGRVIFTEEDLREVLTRTKRYPVRDRTAEIRALVSMEEK